MKKTFSISINNTPFTIEEDAYHKLEAYLNTIKAHFAGTEDSEEIIKDIEARIAEKLSELPHAITTQKDVESIIEDMGTINQFDDEAKTASSLGTKTKKRLYRDTDSAVIAGVASGLGHYFGIDPILIRLIFIIIVLAGGSGIIIYLILWFIIPEAETTAQKLEMRGDPVTLSNMSEIIKEKFESIDSDKIKAGAEKVARMPHGILRSFAAFIQRFVFPSIRILFGSIFMIGGIVVSLGITVGFGILLFAVPSSYLSTEMATIIHNPLAYAVIAGLYFAFLVPAIVVFFWGLGSIGKKSYVSKGAYWSLFLIWVVAVIISIVGGTRFVMKTQEARANDPAFQTTSRTLSYDSFESLYAADSIAVTYVQGSTYSLTVTGTEYDLDHLAITNTENSLAIDRTRDHSICFFICSNGRITATVTAPALEAITLRDASTIEGAMTTRIPLTLTVRDASRATMDIDGTSLILIARDASKIVLSGRADSEDVTLSDASRYDGQAMKTATATISARDASRAEIAVSKKLIVHARDASSVRYSGNPEVQKETSDASSVRRIETTE